MKADFNLSKKSFAIYGLGITGSSVINFFKKNSLKNYVVWDDNEQVLKKKFGFKYLDEKKKFLKNLNFVDYIIISPGIKIEKAKLRKILLKNKRKIITDLDIFFMINTKVKTIVVTGTNGKSTTCKIINHVLNKNNIKSALCGNIGSPILGINTEKKTHVVIEASSFQLFYSKFVKPDFAIILNISNDHLDWHGSMNKYLNSKLKIFNLQGKKNLALLNSNNIKKKYYYNKYKGKLLFINIKKYLKIKKKIKNIYLNLKINDENMSFVYAISKFVNIKEKKFIKSLESFKGMPHRYEIFYKKQNKIFINDSKATSFAASKYALHSNENILWILGGLPKLKDKFKLKNIKKNIIKSYIIGKHIGFFKNQLKGKVSFKLSKTLKNAIISVFKDAKKIKNKKITVLFSPASASYDQYKNFEARGNEFKNLIYKYAKQNI